MSSPRAQPSRAAEPSPSLVENVLALWRSGHVRPLKPLATPWLMDAAAARTVGDVLASVHTAVEQVLRWWADGAPFVPKVVLDARLAEVARLDVRAGRLLGFTRYDVVCPAAAPASFHLLEVQAGDPSAMGWHDALAAAMREGLPADAAPLWLMPSHHDVFVRAVKTRRIAFLVSKGAVVESDHALLAAYYRSRGWDAAVADPRTLRFEGGRLRADGREVDAVFRDTVDELVGEGFEDGGRALLAAYRAGAVTVRNSFAAAVADDKGLLEVLSTPEHWDSRLGAVLAACVPWTRCLAERKVSWERREEDLLPLARRCREALVLKPADGYGGFGVVVGAHVAQADWERALDDALRGPRAFVLQRSVALPFQRVFPFGGGELPTVVAAEQHVVHSFWLHEGRLAGAYMRAAASPVVNVHQGGGLAPVFFHPPLQ